MNDDPHAVADPPREKFLPCVLASAEELATILKVSERTVWRLLSAGKLPRPIRFGGNVRWRMDDVQRWIANGCPPANAGKAGV
jgi:excisionase family DNA binding protein